MTSTTTPLTALCNICHSAPPKYTCPRDQVRTCSLACSQSHKRRADCSGIRDPTSYIPKSVLSTSSGIDRDYNYLSSIERNISTAEKDTETRGVGVKPHTNYEKRWHEKGMLVKYLRENGIRVIRAPVGMKRQRDNETRFLNKSRRVVWSVEWVFGHDKKVVEVDEKMTIEMAYKEVEKERKKRKRGDEEVQERVMIQEPEAEEATTSTTIQDNTFYLHKPKTSSRSTVLIPMDPSASLTTNLSQKALLEFPTIYVFHTSTLPQGFITSTQYMHEKATEDADLKQILGTMSESDRAALKTDSDATKPDAEDWDEGKVLEVLQRDVDALER